MDQQHIHCIISDCHYWEQNNKCMADKILVATDEFGENYPESVDASMVNQLSPKQAGRCETTCCKTYVPKGSEYKGMDQARRMDG